jgi:hypothetical protein
MDNVYIQAQDTSGMWRTYHVTMNNSQRILSEMKSLKDRYPNFRVRAVDENGRLLDILV